MPNPHSSSSRKKHLSFNQSYAFVIGVNTYQDNEIKDLKTAVADARAVAMRLKVKQGFDHVLLLTETTKAQFLFLLQWLEKKGQEAGPFSIPNEIFEAQTRETPIGWLTFDGEQDEAKDKPLYPGEEDGKKKDYTHLWLKREALSDITPEKDSLVFYYAGHGFEDRVDDGPSGFLAPADCTHAPSTQIPMNDVYHTLSHLNCLHTLLILDCCFAGKFKYSTATRGRERAFVVPIHKRRLKRYQSSNAWQVLVSAGPAQLANDSARWADLRDHSPFANTLKKALEGKADLEVSRNRGRQRGDGLITATELYLYVWEEVERLTGHKKPQHPDLFEMRQHREGEFIFLNPQYDFDPSKLAKDKAVNPYKGLKPYENKPEDVEVFFGRERVVKDILAHLVGHPVMFVTGASASGKSSVVRAGIFPALKGFECQAIRPSDLLSQHYLEADLEDGNIDALLIDQLEEIFSHPESEELQRMVLSIVEVVNKRAEVERQILAQEPLRKLLEKKTEDQQAVAGETEEKDPPLLFVKGPRRSGKTSFIENHILTVLEKEGHEIHTIPPLDWIKEWDAFEAFVDALDPATPQVLFLDQYEELYNYPNRKNGVEQDLKRLIKTLADRDVLLIIAIRAEVEPEIERSPLGEYWAGRHLFSLAPIKPQLLLAMRSDFEWQLKKSLLKELWQPNAIYRVPPMNQAELREAITGPAWWAMYDFKDKKEEDEDDGIDNGEELISQLVEELSNAPGALPLLSSTMEYFFEESMGKPYRLSLDFFNEKIGGVAGALSKKIDEEFENMSDEEQAMMKKIFLRMVQVNDGEFSRRRVIHSSFFGMTNHQGQQVLNELEFELEDKAIVDKVIDRLGEFGAKLLIQNQNELGEPYIEPIHDALINHWEKCRGWIDEFGKDQLMLQRDLWRAVREKHVDQPQEKATYRSAAFTSLDEKDQATSENISELWESNPRLFRVLDALARAAESQFLDENDPLLDKILSNIPLKDHKSFSSVWQQCKSKEQFPTFNSLIVTGYSEVVLEVLLTEADHWLNFHEKDFIRRSWAKRTKEVMELIRERDEAIRSLETIAAFRLEEVEKLLDPKDGFYDYDAVIAKFESAAELKVLKGRIVEVRGKIMDHLLSKADWFGDRKKYFAEQRSYSTAIEYWNMAKKLAAIPDDWKHLLSNIAFRMNVEVKTHAYDGAFDKAGEMLKRVKSLGVVSPKEIKKTEWHIIRNMVDYVQMHLDKGEKELALSYAEKCLDFIQRPELKQQLSITRQAGENYHSHLQNLIELIDKTWPGRFYPDMIAVKGGTFLMGDAGPQPEVELDDFYLSETQITVRQYQFYLESEGKGALPQDQWWDQRDMPVELTWMEAISYANWLSEKKGLQKVYQVSNKKKNLLSFLSASEQAVEANFRNNGYRLPTEAEWEYAAAGGSLGYDEQNNRLYTWAGTSEFASLERYAWYKELVRQDIYSMPVKWKMPNPLGFYDMTGLKSDWCQDWYGPYSPDLQRNPTGPEESKEIYEQKGWKVVRGGSNPHPAKVYDRGYRNIDNGPKASFRLARK
jgi:formylglycine-generating enzyme required for sulfatase activity/uncharacterized caspase-like protein